MDFVLVPEPLNITHFRNGHFEAKMKYCRYNTKYWGLLIVNIKTPWGKKETHVHLNPWTGMGYWSENEEEPNYEFNRGILEKYLGYHIMPENEMSEEANADSDHQLEGALIGAGVGALIGGVAGGGPGLVAGAGLGALGGLAISSLH